MAGTPPVRRTLPGTGMSCSGRSAAAADPQNAAATNTELTSRPAPGARNAQLPPDILVDRHLVRAERFLADGDPTAALQTMNEILALHEDHDVVLADDFDFQYAQVAFVAGRTQTAITSLNEPLGAVGREGELYREALELLDSAEGRLEREEAERGRARRRAEAERQRAEAERRRAARWGPRATCSGTARRAPRWWVLPGSAAALGRYEVTVGEYREFASATSGRGGQRLFTPRRWQRRRPLLAEPGLSPDGPPSRDMRGLERGPGVCVLVTSRGAPVRSATTGATDWACRTYSGTWPSGCRPAPWTTVGAVSRPSVSASRGH